MAASFVATAVQSNRPLWGLVHRFNCRLAADVHPAHLADELDGRLLERLRQSARAERQLTEWITLRFELDPRGCWDFEQPRRRFALLPAAQLERLVRLVGISALHRQLARIVLGPQIRRLREALGEADYQFAIKRASFLVRQFPAELEPQTLAEDVLAQAAGLGGQVLRGCLAGAPPAVMDRVALKLPPEWDLRRVAPLAEEAVQSAFRLAQRVLTFEVAPELAPCFN